MTDLFAGLFGISANAARASSLFDDNSAFRSKPISNGLVSSLGPASQQGLDTAKNGGQSEQAQHTAADSEHDTLGSKKEKKKKKSKPNAVSADDAPSASLSAWPALADKHATQDVQPAVVSIKKGKKKQSMPEQPQGEQQEPVVEQQQVSTSYPADEAGKLNKKRQRQQVDPEAESEDDDMRSKAQITAAQKVTLTGEEKAERDASAAEKLSRTLFVGNLPLSTTPKQLRQLFSRLGYAVDSARLRSVPVDPEAKMPRRSAILTGKLRASEGATSAGGANGYVVLADVADVAKAVSANMSEFNGHHIRVDRAAAPRQPAATGTAAPAAQGDTGVPALFDAARSIFVGNVDFLVKDEDMIRFFNDERHAAELDGSVEAVRLVRDRDTNIGKGFGFVLFKSKVAARAALALDGQKLGKRPLRITRVAPDARPAQPTKPGARPAGTSGRVPSHTGKVASNLASSDWQGTQTKGKGQGVRGPKAPSSSAAAAARPSSSRPAAVAPEGRQRNSKRPAVAARKKAAKVGASPKTFDKPTVKKPRWVPRNSAQQAA